MGVEDDALGVEFDVADAMRMEEAEIGAARRGHARAGPSQPRAAFTAAVAAWTINPTSLAMVTSLKPFLIMRLA